MARARDSNGKFIPIHSGKHTKLYKVWCSMKERCSNPHNKSYRNYGAKGISVCEEWGNDFSNFQNWAINNGYGDKLTIDRIDTKQNYCPENCRWVTTQQQNRNYSRNHKVEYNGKTYCIVELAEKFDIDYRKLLYRINAGYTIENAIKKGDNRYGSKKRTI